MVIHNTQEFEEALNLYSPYVKAFIFYDGEVCCETCARKNAKLIKDAIQEGEKARNDWCVVGVDNIEEDNGEEFVNCNEKILED